MDRNLKKEQIDPYVLIDETDKDAILDMESEAVIGGTQYLYKDVFLGKIKLSNEPEIAVTNEVFDRIEDKTPFLGNYTVQEVQDIVDAGEAENYWCVGDITDPIELNGTVGICEFDHESYRAMIIGFNHNADLETDGKCSMTLQFGQNEDGVNIAFTDSSFNSAGSTDAFKMNTSNTNSGGWESSYMRNTICPEFLEVLPSSLQNVISTTTKYTDNVGGGNGDVESNVTATEDKIFLLSYNESGLTSTSYPNSYETALVEPYSDMYSSNSDRIRYKHSAPSSTCGWWLRSPRRTYSIYFCGVNTNGSGYDGYANYSFGFAPCFTMIGSSPADRTMFTVYSEDDDSLIFYYKAVVPTEGRAYNGKTVTKVYTIPLTDQYTESDPPAWHEICNQIKSVSFDTSFEEARPVYTSYWFYEMANCTSMDVRNLNTSQTIDMHDTFSGLESLESLDVSNLDVRNVQSLYGTFYNCAKLTTIDVSNWKTDSLTNMRGVFDTCLSLESVDLTGWDTSKVTTTRRLFNLCESLKTIDISKMDTSSATDISNMFQDCTELKTIYSDDSVFVATNASTSGSMFLNCVNLVGGAGTTFSSSNTGSSMAHIDTLDNPGYFTDVNASPVEAYDSVTVLLDITVNDLNATPASSYNYGFNISLTDSLGNVLEDISLVGKINDENDLIFTAGVSDTFTLVGSYNETVEYTIEIPLVTADLYCAVALIDVDADRFEMYENGDSVAKPADKSEPYVTDPLSLTADENKVEVRCDYSLIYFPI